MFIETLAWWLWGLARVYHTQL